MKKCNRLAVAHVKAVFLFFQISVRENVRYTGLSDTPNPQETIPAEVPRSREGRRQKSLRVEKKERMESMITTKGKREREKEGEQKIKKKGNLRLERERGRSEEK